MESKTLKLSLIQLHTKLGDKKYNFNKVSKFAENIFDTDFLVLPEVWAVGWDCKIFRDNAEKINESETIKFLSELAKSKNINIIGGSFIRKEDGRYYNSCPVINKKGELVAIYDKNHLYSYYGCDEGKYITSGNNPVLVELDGIKIGLTICYDIRFPEIYRAYRKNGADILINCAAWASTKPVPWEIMTKSRAIENQTYMIAVNQFGEIDKDTFNLGHSRIIDYNGNVKSEILDGEGLVSAQLNLSDMYEFRQKCKILNDVKETYEVEKYA